MIALAITAVTALSGTALSGPIPPTTVLPETPGMLVTYERTGGFAGLHDRVTVDETGMAVIKSTPVALTSAELRGLRRDLARITTMESSTAGCDIADHLTYTLIYRDRQATRCQMPSDWRAAAARLDGLIRRGN